MGRRGYHALRPGLGGAQPRFVRRLRVRAYRPGSAAQYLHGVAALAREPEEARSAPRERAWLRDEPGQGRSVSAGHPATDLMDLEDIKLYVDDRPEEGAFRVHRDLFADPELFELEQKYIFERTWAFLAFESQLAKPHDFTATHIGRVPVIVTRDAAGKLGAFLNVCRHKGTMLCRVESGNRKYHVCNYHGWAYDSGGKNIDIKDRKNACYSPAFDAEDHNLVPLARFANYKGLLFGSLSADVPPFDEYLGELKFFIDLAMEQGPRGMECVPGRITYTFDANWKLQMDNGVDQYHLTSTHTSFMEVVRQREKAKSGNQAARAFDWDKRLGEAGRRFS